MGKKEGKGKGERGSKRERRLREELREQRRAGARMKEAVTAASQVRSTARRCLIQRAISA